MCLDFVWIDLYASGWDVFMELTTKHRSVPGQPTLRCLTSAPALALRLNTLALWGHLTQELSPKP